MLYSQSCYSAVPVCVHSCSHVFIILGLNIWLKAHPLNCSLFGWVCFVPKHGPWPRDDIPDMHKVQLFFTAIQRARSCSPYANIRIYSLHRFNVFSCETRVMCLLAQLIMVGTWWGVTASLAKAPDPCALRFFQTRFLLRMGMEQGRGLNPARK